MKLKKIATLFLTVSILATMCFGLTAEAAVNLIPNGDFSQWENGAPVGWTLTAAEGRTYEMVSVDDAAVEAKTALKITGTGFGVTLNEEYRDLLVPGATYQISYMFKGASGGGMYLNIYSSKTDRNFDQGNTTFFDAATPKVAHWGGKASAWEKRSFEFKASSFADFFWIDFSASNMTGDKFITDVKIEGILRPQFHESVVKGDTIVSNGDFAGGDSTGWTLGEGTVLTTDADNSYLSLTGAQKASYDLTFTGTPAEIYEVELDVMTTAADVTTAAGAPKIEVDTFLGETPMEGGSAGHFYDKIVDYDFTFKPLKGNGAWEKIIFNISPPSITANLKIRLTLSSAVAGVTVCYDNLRVCSTNNRFANGGFEGIPFANKTFNNGATDYPVTFMGGLSLIGSPLWSTDAKFTGEYGLNVPKGNGFGSTNNVATSMMIRAKAGRTYRVSMDVNTPSFAKDQQVLSMRWRTLAMAGATASLNDSWGDVMSFHPEWYGWCGTSVRYFTLPTTYTDADGNVLPWDTETVELQLYGPSQSNYAYIDNVEITEVETGVGFYTEAGEKLESMAEAAGETVVAYYLSDKLPSFVEDDYGAVAAATNTTMIVALYEIVNGTRQLVKFNYNVGVNSMAAPAFSSVAVPDDGKTYEISAFPMDSFAGLHALENKVDLT